MNDDEVRRRYHNAIANGDPRTRALAAECLRRGEVIATYEGIIGLLREGWRPDLALRMWVPVEGGTVMPMSDVDRALLEGDG